MKKSYTGSCHCGAIKFECNLDLAFGTRRCNCSFCWKSRYWKAFAMKGDFQLLEGREMLSDYQASVSEWPKGDVHHYFCKRCGIRPFSQGYLEIEPFNGAFHAVSISTLDNVTDLELASAEIQYEDGRSDCYDAAPDTVRHL